VSGNAIKRVDLHVAGRIRHRRKLLGMTQAEVADFIGVSVQQMQKYESGRDRITAGYLFAIAMMLGVNVDYFYERVR
jgi:transcriptional regulator with XRE-family HTH domain